MTGPAPDAPQPRCGIPDTPTLALAFGVGRRWPGTDLTYSFVNFSGRLPEADVRFAVRMAFDLWSEVTPLLFAEVEKGGDIRIAFRSGDHGCGYPFDGSQGVLAHAFGPGAGLGGDTHFDESERWAVDAAAIAGGAVDLVTVAAHEFGHALGLDHTPTPGTLMYPSFSGPHRFLSAEDVARIQALYGPPPRRGDRP